MTPEFIITVLSILVTALIGFQISYFILINNHVKSIVNKQASKFLKQIEEKREIDKKVNKLYDKVHTLRMLRLATEHAIEIRSSSLLINSLCLYLQILKEDYTEEDANVFLLIFDSILATPPALFELDAQDFERLENAIQDLHDHKEFCFDLYTKLQMIRDQMDLYTEK